ncbi:APC family permease [Kineococcus aurantiacus]|uniref:Amino acid transporter n=1 Tax=Kineococcus aurantiacus TaxID=37633 RepID=A0A7Y9J3F4_9ACTN|nr:APC family permease [Kineococcus aurantiacus]NYD25194.1 amino acid transporter [Kineococcus aurantiacus]
MKSVDAPLSGQLGVGSILFMVVAAAAPLTAIAGLSPVGVLQGNGAGYPAMYLILGALLVLFSLGFCAMAPRVREAGGFYSYIRMGLGNRAGAGASFLAMFAYVAGQIAMYPFIGLQIANLADDAGIPMPWWAATLLVILGVGYLGYRNIDFSAKILGAILVIEIVVTLAVSAAIIGQGGDSGLTVTPFEPSMVFSGSIALGFMFAVSAFIGFEGTAIYRDEARDPERTIPRATYIAVTSIAVFYAFSTWTFVMGWGVDDVAAEAARTLAHGDMYQQTATRYIGTWMGVVINVFLVTSNLACILAQHNVTARYMFSNARTGLLPERLGMRHAKHASPATASLTTSIMLTVVTVALIAAGLDPYAQTYTWFSGVAVVAIVLLMATTSLAVVTFFRKTPSSVGVLRRAVAPIVSAVLMAVLFVVIVINFNRLTGDVDSQGRPTFGPVTLSILAAIVVAPVAGWLWQGVRDRRRPLTSTGSGETPNVDEVQEANR